MIAGWMLYCVIVATLFCVAAAAVDAILTARNRPARWVWIIAMFASLALPIGIRIMQRQTPVPPPGSISLGDPFSGPTKARADIDSRASGAKPSATTQLTWAITLHRTPEWLDTDPLATATVILCILVAAIRIAFDSAVLFRARQRWREHEIDGERVLVSDDFGPAIVGLLTPRIVLPEWALALESEDGALMLAHEREHSRAHDSQITTISLLSVLCMPWNPPIWWMLRRLRLAIEIDCDRRVLATQPNVARYARLLVEVAARAAGTSLAVAGFSERAVPLARRIHAMTTARRPRAASAMGLALVTALAIVSSAMILPPTAPIQELREYTQSTIVLPANVGDSIAEEEESGLRSSPGAQWPVSKIIAAARDLPRVFTVESYGPFITNEPRCAWFLRDDRDGTTLRISSSQTKVLGGMQYGDTVLTTRVAIGFYHVQPVGRYGVGESQYLRVGCGNLTTIHRRRSRP